MGGKSTPPQTDIRQNELLTVKEVASYLRVGRVTVWRWCKEGIIPACRVGRTWRIPRDDFLDLLEAEQPFKSESIQAAATFESQGPVSPSADGKSAKRDDSTKEESSG